MPKMTFIERDGTRREVDAPLGLSVLEIAHKHGVDIEGACEGSLACSTCHVIVDPAWFDRLATPTEDEEDMLDSRFRLGGNLPPGLPDRRHGGARWAGRQAAGGQPQHDERVAMRILVAMSGGVDSSVVAARLAEAGHDVIGATLQLYHHGAASGRKGACCAGQDIHDARRVADRLAIPHYVIDAEARFAKAVIGDFADAYAAGETPVPCVRCNQTVKFTDLLALARGLGAERLATGHYVRRIDGPGGAELHRARDKARDQSWFLFATSRAQLEATLFPLGEMADKAAVRAEAARFGLAVAAKPDSQDLCFIPSGSYADLVGRLRPEALTPGEIVDGAGRVLGRHHGIARYTVGQARRLGAAGGEDRIVVELDAPRRRVVVGPRGAGTRSVRLRSVNWLVAPPAGPLRCLVKLRAREEPQPATVASTGDGAELRLDAPGLPAPGQACVFYDNDRVLGGGWITARPAEAPAVDGATPAGLSAPPAGSDGGVAQR